MAKEAFVLTKDALNELLDFLQNKEPWIIGKTCQMLSALKIATMPPKEAFPFVIDVINAMKEKGIKLTGLEENQWSDFRLDTLDQYLPKILKERKWVYSIENYVINKLINSFTVESRRRARLVPLYIEREDKNGKKALIENPEIEKGFDETRIENAVEINKIFEIAKLTDREIRVYCYKEVTNYTEKLIAEILEVSRETVKRDYSKAKERIEKALH